MAIDFNDPKTWCSAEIYRAPEYDRAAFQARLNAICGVAPNGQPNLRLVWAGEAEAFSPYYSEWDEGGSGTKTVLRAKYPYTTYADADIIIDVPAARWVIEQRMDGAQYAADDNQGRWQTKYIGQAKIEREMRPKRPANGYYVPFIVVGKHYKGDCCRAAKTNKLKCWGDYCQPDGSYLDLIRRSVAGRAAEPETQSRYEPISNDTLRRAALEANAATERRNADANAAVTEYVTENFEAIVTQFLGRDVLPDTKAFSLPSGHVKTASGLILPRKLNFYEYFN